MIKKRDENENLKCVCSFCNSRFNFKAMRYIVNGFECSTCFEYTDLEESEKLSMEETS